MHLVIPFAAPLTEGDGPPKQALAALQLPQLAALTSRLTLHHRDEGDAWSLSPPHERALARDHGWAGADGCLPWAAHAAIADGIATDDLAWALLTPVHWHLGTEQVSLMDPARLMLDEASSRTFFEAVSDLFTSEGYAFAFGAADRWYAAHESFDGLPTASLDRVIGRNVDRWLGNDPALRRIRRLQGEVQMLLYTHPLNDERIARGLLPVNSFWLSGCGLHQPARGAAVVDARLRAPALAGDWAAWVKAWETLDAGPLRTLADQARDGQPVQLTLCGERSSVTLATQPRNWLDRLRQRFASPTWRPLLESL